MLELDGRTLSYSEFKEKCLQTNLPAIIRHANGLSNLWFNVEFLKSHLSPEGLLSGFGEDYIVPAYAMPTSCSVDPRRGSAQDTVLGANGTPDGATTSPALSNPLDDADFGSCEEISLKSVVRSWLLPVLQERALVRGGHCKVYYLKDWHMQQDTEARQAVQPGLFPYEGFFPPQDKMDDLRNGAGGTTRQHGTGLYRVPDYLGVDWMDCFFVEVGAAQRQGWGGAKPFVDDPTSLCGFGNGHSDYRFSYIGPTGTWTPLHCDVFGTYSWSFNVCGEKRWFFPTKEGNEFLRRHAIKGFPTPPDIRVLQGFEYWSFVQRPGELVFVPSQYYHQVHNTEGEVFELPTTRSSAFLLPPEEVKLRPVTISVNHNWCNEFCIESMVHLFLDDVDYLRRNLDPEDMAAIYGPNSPALWSQKLETMLLNGSNWSFASMLSFLGYIQARFEMLDESVLNTLASLERKVREKQSTLFT